MGEHLVERARHVGEIERLDEEARVADLAPGAAAQEAPQLLLDGSPLPRGLLLEGAERSQVALRVDDLLHGGGAESADQLLLEIGVAHVEAQPLHLVARELGAETGSVESTAEVFHLGGVAETREPEVEPLWAVQIEESSDRLRTADRDDRNTLGLEIPAAALGQRLEGGLVARSFDEYNRA